MCLKKAKKIKGQIILNSKIQKNRYMKINNVFLASKVLISNDADPSGKESRNLATQKNKNNWIANNMDKMTKLEPERART